MAKQRMIKMEQRGAETQLQALETKSDEELESETKFRSAALAILGARAAERYDHKAARTHFERAIAAARPQERMQIRRMRDASLALAERRPDQLKQAVERLGQEAPSGRQLFLLRLMGMVAPPPGSGIFTRLRGFVTILLLVVGVLAVGFGIVELVALPFGGTSVVNAAWIGALVVIAALAILALFGRRKQAKAKAAQGR